MRGITNPGLEINEAALEDIGARNEDLQQLYKSIHELRELFVDIAAFVEYQVNLHPLASSHFVAFSGVMHVYLVAWQNNEGVNISTLKIFAYVSVQNAEIDLLNLKYDILILYLSYSSTLKDL